jgi:apolipoprotein N-acyltransferase
LSIDYPDLGHGRRFLGALGAWGLFWAASPGVVSAPGLPLVAAAGVAVWGAVELCPLAPRRPWLGFLAHALGALPGAAALMLWIRFVYAPPLLYIGLGMGLYSAAGGVLLRRLARALPPAGLPLAVAFAFTAMETLRAAVPMPFGLGWMRVGYQAHAWDWLAGGARVWGVSGLTFALAGLGGLGSALWLERARALRGLPAGLLPAAVGALLRFSSAPPPTVPGPLVLVVQPGFPQERKQFDDPRDNFSALRDETAAALAAARAAGRPEPDLVAWGESMLYLPVFTAEARRLLPERTDPGAEPEVAEPPTPTLADVAFFDRLKAAWVDGEIFGRGERVPAEGGILAPGTSFLAGAEVAIERGGELRRLNGAVLFGADGSEHVAGKRFLVPGAETMYGLERLAPVRRFIRAVSGYVPDFAAAERTAVLPLKTRDGRSFGVATTVCFDNAHLAPYTDPVGDGAADFHLIVSNEAWYEESFEADQMVAFSRIAALASGRAVVRATNSGISLVLGPDGRELGRITAGGRDRMVQGELWAVVPVPKPGSKAPPIAFLWVWLDALWVLGPFLGALLGAAGHGRRSAGGGIGNPAAHRG